MTKGFSVFTAFKAKDGMTPAFKSMTGASNSFSRGLNNASAKAKGLGSSLQQTSGKINALINTALGYFAFDAIKDKLNSFVDSASNLQETIGKTGEVFKTNSDEVTKWAKTSIKSMGLAEQTALDTASLYGDMATGMGLSTKRAAEMSKGLTQLSADLASFKNVEQGLSANALKGIFTGETEALKNLGVVMTETTLQEYARANGVRKKLKDMTQAEKIELRYQYVLKSTKNAQGDFLRTFSNYANQKRVGEELKKQSEINFGNVLMPTYNRAMVAFNSFLTKNLDSITKTFERIFNFVSGLFAGFKPVLNELKVSFKIFSDEILPNIIALAPGIKMLFENVLVPGLTITIASFNKLLEILSGTYNFMKDNFIPIGIVLGGILSGLALFKTVQFFQALAVQMALGSMSAKAFIVANGGLIPALKVLGASIMTSTKAMFGLNASMLASPLFWIPIAIAAVVAGAILIWKNWDKIISVFGKFWEVCKSVFGQFKVFFQNNFVDILLAALGPIGWLIKGVQQLGSAVGGIGNKGGGSSDTGGGGSFPSGNIGSPRANNGGINTRYNQGSGGSFGGKIEVVSTLNNNTAFPATSSVNLMGNSGLNLVPVRP